MKVSPTVPRGESPRSLTELATEVRRAREHVLARRMAPATLQDLVKAQHALLQTMEAYVTELTVRHLPIPHRLRDDLRLQRDLCGSPHDRHGPAPRQARRGGPHRT
jgi:hypothetical protein